MVYRIVARSELSERYACAFEGKHMESEDERTILTGKVKDQPHLFDILERINGLGMELLSVEPSQKKPTLSPRGSRSSKPRTQTLATSPDNAYSPECVEGSFGDVSSAPVVEWTVSGA
jgi:hypothetical protein